MGSDVTAYMCAFKAGGIEVMEHEPDAKGPDAIETSVGSVVAPLAKGPKDRPQIFAKAPMWNVLSWNPYFCKNEDVLRLKIEINDEGWPVFIQVQWKNPEMCNWIRTVIYGEHYGPLVIQQIADYGGGPIPSNKSDVLVMPKGWQTVQIKNLVPGEKVMMDWFFTDAVANSQANVAAVWFATKTLTGGRCKRVNGDLDQAETTVDVEIEGKVYKGMARTDFYPYEDGDWIYIRKDPRGEGIDNYGPAPWDSRIPTSGRTVDVPKYGGNGIILPVSVSGIGVKF